MEDNFTSVDPCSQQVVDPRYTRVISSKPSWSFMISQTRPLSGSTGPQRWKSSFKQKKQGTKRRHAMLLQWCPKLRKFSWAHSVCVFAGCNLQPHVQRELAAICRDQRCCCSRHLLTWPLRNEYNNVPFTGQMTSNCEELGHEGYEKGRGDRRGWWTLQEEKKNLDKTQHPLLHGAFSCFCWVFFVLLCCYNTVSSWSVLGLYLKPVTCHLWCTVRRWLTSRDREKVLGGLRCKNRGISGADKWGSS